MVKVSFEHEGNEGLLTLVTHFGTEHQIRCTKTDDGIFRLGGTAVNEVYQFEGLVRNPETGAFRAFLPTPPHDHFEGVGTLSPENWADGPDRHCWITEFYDLEMEGKEPGWLISRNPISEANQLFVNLDVIDGGGNILKRYRVSPFFGDYRVME